MNSGGNNEVEFARRLLEAVRETQKNLRRVEIWASAMTAFNEPIPSYNPDDKYLLPREFRSESNRVENVGERDG